MKMKGVGLPFFSFLAFVFIAGAAFATDGADVMKRTEAAFYYPGSDFRARVMMRLTAGGGQERIREMTLIRKNYGAGNQRYFIYFFQPADVRDTTFMVYKYPERDDDRWLFVPAINMVKRIAAKDKGSSFVGSDFTYEDISGRDVGDDAHTVVREEILAGRSVYVVKSVPKDSGSYYSYKLSWIDAGDYLPRREEYYDGNGELYKVFTADEVGLVKGIPTIMKRSMKNIKSGHGTVVTFSRVDYNTGIEDGLFTERFLKQPPRKRLE